MDKLAPARRGICRGNPAAGVINGSLWSLIGRDQLLSRFARHRFATVCAWFKAPLVATLLLVLVLLRPENLVSAVRQALWTRLLPRQTGFDVRHRRSFDVATTLLTNVVARRAGSAANGLVAGSSLKTAAYAVSMAVTVLGLATHLEVACGASERMGDWSYGFLPLRLSPSSSCSLGAYTKVQVLPATSSPAFCTAIAAATSWYLVERPWLLRPRGGNPLALSSGVRR